MQTTLARISCRTHKLELHAAQSASDKLMRGDLSAVGVPSAADVGVVHVPDAGHLEPMDFKLMVSAIGSHTAHIISCILCLPDASQCKSSQVLELLVDIAQAEGQQDTPYSAALLVGVPVSCLYFCLHDDFVASFSAFIYLNGICFLSFSFPPGFSRHSSTKTATAPQTHAAAGSLRIILSCFA